MEPTRRTISRNNRIIIITCLLIALTSILTIVSQPEVELLLIQQGDSSFELANTLKNLGSGAQISNDRFRIPYTPPTPWAALKIKEQQSSYEIYFSNNRVTTINWYNQSGTLIAADLKKVTVAIKKGK